LVALRKILVPRRRKKPRPDGPRTIVPPRDAPADRFDAAKARLRAKIPPRADERE
jgi:hypothetical protein